MKYSRLFVYLCGFLGIVISVRGTMLSISIGKSYVIDVISLVLWILYLYSFRSIFKQQIERKKDSGNP